MIYHHAGGLGAAEVWGIEPAVEPAARAAEVLTHLIQAPYPTAEAAEGAPFDLVVFADSLEHLMDPWEGLAEAHRVLAVDGALLLSLPNISHYTVLCGLRALAIHGNGIARPDRSTAVQPKCGSGRLGGGGCVFVHVLAIVLIPPAL